tara:strand:+ start:1265 stop:3556 length:2292 start_codon:yes stop_codon:yes gene_type:complete
MTSSFQSTSFQSSARPVDTFVRQSTVPLIEEDGFSQLTKALSAVNPVLDMFMKRSIEDEQAEGMDIAIEQSFEGFKETSKEIGKNKGEDAARQLIGGSIFADRAYQKTKAQILGNNFETNLSTSYQTTRIDGKSLSEFSIDSPEYQNWLASEREKVVDQLSDVRSIYVAEHFLPKLASATETVSSHHIKEFKKIKVENIKSLAIPLVENIIISPDTLDEKLILDFENTINNLGLPAKDRSDINKTLVKVITESAEAIGLSGNGDIDSTEEILAIAEKFPYGPGGSLNLTSHPDYQSKVNTLRRQVNDYVYKSEKRRDLQKKRLQDEDIENNVKAFIETGDPRILENTAKKYPFKAKDILSTGNVLDMDGRTTWAETRINIQSNAYGSKEGSFDAAMNWFNSVENSPQNRTLLKDLLDATDDAEKGLYTEINKGLTELKSELTGEFRKDSVMSIFGTGQLNNSGTRNVNDFYNQAKIELYEYRTSEAGRKATTLEIINKINEIKLKYINKAREMNPATIIESGKNPTNNSNNLDDIQGDANSNLEAGAFTDDDTPTTVTVEQGDTLTQLADQFSTTVEAIMRENNITNADLIQAGQELIMPVGDVQTLNITDGSKQQAIVSAANELGVRPEDLAAVISQETMGTFDPQIIGGENNNFKGLIQFGIPERKAYGYRDGMSFEEQMLGPVVRYLKDRGVKPGHGVKELYAAILTGNVSTLDTDGLTRKDSFGTSVESALPELNQGGSHYNNALDFLSEQGRFQQNSN